MKPFKIAKKAYLAGPLWTYKIIKNRIRKNIFIFKYMEKAINHKATHNWENLSKKCLNQESFKKFLQTLKKSKEKFFYTNFYKKNTKNSQEIINLANKYTENIFNVLGSDNTQLDEINWHLDFRLKNRNQLAENCFNENSFYSEIKIASGKTEKEEKDIKIPWELSRLHHLAILGHAYHISDKKEKYANSFLYNVTDWIDKNSFLLGINWTCPMEVAIRAINLIHAFYFFCNSKNICDRFWKKITCSLYDHFIYLENNWELSDSKTSNHYLSDLLGYFCLSLFFKELKNSQYKIKWCYKEILKEFDRQIFDEGTSYEGSTAYHKFVTEIFMHFYITCKNTGIILPQSFIIKLNKVVEFIEWCTPENGQLILIGDNDSGHILHPLCYKNKTKNIKNKKHTKNYKSFGISIIKTKKYHITLRHHTYSKKQPSGHFHNDFAAVTLNIDGTQILTDSGSYVYTPSCKLRNDFRSAKAHSTFFIDSIEPVQFSEKIFELNIPENLYYQKNDAPRSKLRSIWESLQIKSVFANKPSPRLRPTGASTDATPVLSSAEGPFIPASKMLGIKAKRNKHVFEISTEHNLYKHLGLKAKRSISLNELNNNIIIKDQWITCKKVINKNYDISSPNDLVSCWNFILGPNVTPVKNNNYLELTVKDKKIILISNILNFEIEDTWISPHYGQKIKTKKLIAKSNITADNVFINFILYS
ncbi:heparinase II/III family protein [Candidatus Dependentiae bacterium]